MSELKYEGNELDIFSAARNWKQYLYENFSPFLGAEVLEVGAGFGGTTPFLAKGQHARWVGLEPDPGLFDRFQAAVRQGQLPAYCQPVKGILSDLAPTDCFDTILYVDVLEHIEHDAEELRNAAAHLKPGGHVVVLSPAHPFLYTPFDKAIGHFRRYTRASLRAVAPSALREVRMIYLDAFGLLSSLGNRLFLQQSMPTRKQVALWDGVLVPASRLLDGLFLHALGKSVLGVWQRPVG